MNDLRAATACVVAGLALTLGGAARALPISTGLVGWYDANDIDANPLTANPASGTPVTTWVNKANPGTNNGTAYGTAPAPTVQANAMNGRSVLRFGGNDYYGMGNVRTADGPYSYFGVTASTSSGGQTWQRIVSTWDGVGLDWNGYNWAATRPCTNTSSGAAVPYPSPWSGFVSTMSAASGKKIMGLRFGNDSQNNSEWLTGDMSEVLIYTRQLNAAEQIITQNYLMAKYNGTNATVGSPQPAVTNPTNNVYAGDDPARGNYDLDVFGVGRVNATNQFSDSAASSIANGGLRLAALGGVDDGEWLLAGHKVLANSLVTSDLPFGMDERWDRVWYLDLTGTVDARVAFDFSDAGIPYTPLPAGSVYELLYSPTNTFEGTESPFTRLGWVGGVAGDEVSFRVPSGSLADGYYTLGVGQAIPEPASFSLLLAGLGLAALRRRRARAPR